ncbi:MAG TPA: ABC transporter substrate-binding protein [Acidiphilium sp.]|nr:MAG: toluene tolerance protein [Acidiphilium sp. 21-60-14]OYV90994.1 MAG: toluene tolerance protein [Acidiphilium sp. 37-60-79]OZB38881.1 MAG: toluene tolerance protein [Acidiphilium sp. 34-60-192]HQT88579.1 ABC transporter substrate-binding protein [Acidiphilium sp.]HQU24547.1 ABC transporter substrate-binding protein [Acidiphilium sp.]
MMGSRRVLLGGFAVMPMLGALSAVMPGVALAAPSVSGSAAEAFIKNAGEGLVAIVNGPGSKAAKADKLRQLVSQIVAVGKIGRFVLGRFVRVATPAQVAEYEKLFHELLAYNITTQIRAYQGLTFTVKGASTGPEGEMVSTVITRPGQSPAHVQWVVQSIGGQPKIIDVVVEGTSLRVTERSDYASVIDDNGGQVAALLKAMHQQLARMRAS